MFVQDHRKLPTNTSNNALISIKLGIIARSVTTPHFLPDTSDDYDFLQMYNEYGAPSVTLNGFELRSTVY